MSRSLYARIVFEAGVREYREIYWTPGYQPRQTDVLAAFRVIPQPDVAPEEAAAAVARLQARLAVPIHWGTYYPLYVGPASFLTEPAEAFQQAAAELAPGTSVRVLAVGETLELEPVEVAR